MSFNLENFFEFYAGEVQQREGVSLLAQSMPSSLLSDKAAWVRAYRGELPQQQVQGEAKLANPLHVPYDSQHDNPSGEGWRECFSSSCAMVAKFWLPELDMNDYLRRRPAYGDSTDASAQIRCLESFGLSARFVQVGSIEKLKAQIDRGRPAPVGFLHHGRYDAPTGGGHYAVAIGYTDESVIMNDPNGHLDPIEGGYLDNTRAEGVHYLWDFWAPRWSVANDHDGWGLDISKP